MRSFVISLDRATDRRKQFFAAAKRHRWQVEVFPAVDKADLIVTPEGETKARVTHRRDESIHLAVEAGSWGHISLGPGHYACALSHLALWKNLIESGDSHWCLFEDDAVIEQPYLHLPLPSDADFVFLSDRVHSLVPDEICTQMEFESWKATNSFAPLVPGCGTEAYIVTRKGAETGLRLMHPMFWPIDLQLMAYGHGAIAARHERTNERRDKDADCRIYATTETYTSHVDHGVSYLNE
jgi:GR25 family glycosyltransferase involved in LPS biosynthesis